MRHLPEGAHGVGGETKGDSILPVSEPLGKRIVVNLQLCELHKEKYRVKIMGAHDAYMRHWLVKG